MSLEHGRALKHERAGFTLIELSIVLVIIGLIVGGILVGQDLIKAAEVRAQVSQIEKYNSAVNTFRSKFQAIPGDMAVATANQFGFATGSGCTGGQGARDGNGFLDGYSSPTQLVQGEGEVMLFFQDLSSAVAGNLIDGQFPGSGAVTNFCLAGGAALSLSTSPGTTYLGDYYPNGKIGHGTYIYVYENSGYNWYGLSTLTSVNNSGCVNDATSIPAVQAFKIDQKVDDGLPATGGVQANYLTGCYTVSVAPNAASDSTTTCYNTTSNAYSISSLANYGAGGNCALSFRFQ
jgi:prepilin-type N-terminal cleavage/methylation domain-containing protein